MDPMKEFGKGVPKLWEKYKYAAVIVLVGMGLLLWPEHSSLKEATVPRTAVPEIELQSQLETILGTMAGVGQVEVLLTVETDGTRQLAQDTKLRYSGSVEAPEKYERSSEIIMKDGTVGDEPMVVQTQYPTYRGALIVCQGGDQADVKLAVTAAVMSLTGLTSDHISVAKYQ